MSSQGKLRVTYSSRGTPRYELEIWHSGLKERHVVKGTNKVDVLSRAQTKMAHWDRSATRIDNKQQAADRTAEAQGELRDLETILIQGIEHNSAVDWESLKNFSDYEESQPKPPVLPKMDFITKLIPAWRKNFEDRVAKQVGRFREKLVQWENQKDQYIKERDKANELIEKKKEAYLSGDVNSFIDYCDMVLSSSQYPDFFPQTYELEYRPEGKLLVINYQLPAPAEMPTLEEVKFIQTRNEFGEKHISQIKQNKLYDDLLYQVALRTLHELFNADKVDALISIVFNGFVRSVDPATGHEVNACVLTIQANKDELAQINLSNVDPKACFKSLKGVGSSKLHSLTPIAPLILMNKEDSRFVASYGVADQLDESVNIAAMDWEDFEHLIRELFEKEFVGAGGEVKVTQASRDGGVDAVAFDPDPIRGGKIIIQAKRYTNTVGVSAVRDLYGTVVNEGAIKGILVTTADYGPDAYNFAREKPITLMNGNNLLFLLQKHGYKAKIDVKEAKKLLS